jgi:F-type H+-transporting ATPase subunit b
MLVVLALAEEAAPPLIDLDGTFFVQLGLFVLTLFVLSRTLFGPYLKMRADRERGIGGARAEAQKMGEQARSIVEDYDQKLTAAKRRGAEERNKLQKEATARERELVGKARSDAQSTLEAARKKIAADTETGRAAMTTEATQLARKVASKALGREVA